MAYQYMFDDSQEPPEPPGPPGPPGPQGPAPDDTGPQQFIWGEANMTYHYRDSYEVNGYFYRFVGIRPNERGQRLPLLQLQPGGSFGGPAHTPGYAPQYPALYPPPPQFQVPPQQYQMPPQQYQMPPQQYQMPPQFQQQPFYGYLPPPQTPYGQHPVGDPSVPTWRIPTVGIAPPTPEIAAAIAARAQPQPFTGQGTHYQQFVPQELQYSGVGAGFPDPALVVEGAEEETHSVATFDPKHNRNLSFTVKHNWNTENSELKDVILIEDDKLPQTHQERDGRYLAQLIVDCGLQNEMLEFKRQQPMAFICEVRNPSEPSSGDRFAIVYDFTPSGYMFASRRLTEDHNLGQKVLCVKQNGEATPQTSFDFTGQGQGIDVRVLIVGRNGWLVYFAPDRPWILTENQYLVFTSSQSQIAFKHIYDAKREDGKEAFFKQYILSGTAPVDGMVIYQAVIQRDTPKDGTFAVIGVGNAVLAMTQIQNMITESQSPKHYYDRQDTSIEPRRRPPSGARSPQASSSASASFPPSRR